MSLSVHMYAERDKEVSLALDGLKYSPVVARGTGLTSKDTLYEGSGIDSPSLLTDHQGREKEKRTWKTLDEVLKRIYTCRNYIKVRIPEFYFYACTTNL